MGCCTSLIKYFLIIFNVIFWLAGGALLGVGIWLKVDPNVDSIVQVVGVSISYGAAIGFIVLGVVMFVIGFFGCCGALKENRCLLGTYFTFVFIIFVAQLGIGIWTLVSQSSIENIIKTGLNDSLPINKTGNVEKSSSVIAMQETFKCCGLVNGCGDWNNQQAFGCSCTPSSTNDTKCQVSTTCVNADSAGQAMYTEDCYDAIIDFVQDHIAVFAGVAIGIAVAEIFLMISAIVMCCTAGKEGYETY